MEGVGVALAELGGRSSVLVVQCNRLNNSRIRTVIVCPLTSNLERGVDIGNVRLEMGEGNPPKPSIVNVSQFYTLDKADLVEYIGTLSLKRIREVVVGVVGTFAVGTIEDLADAKD